MIRTVLFLALVACGSKQPAPAPTMPEHAESGGGSGMAGMDHEMMAPELKPFHDVLAPRWHAAKGAPRIKDTCDAVPQFQVEADKIGKTTPPHETNADTWTNGTRGLADAVTGLATACKAPDEPKFDAAFEKVHNAFHALMEAGGGHHEEARHEDPHHHE